jgi:integrase
VTDVSTRPYIGHPFLELPLDRLQIEDAKPIFVFDAAIDLAFLQTASACSFPAPFTLAKASLTTTSCCQPSAP